MSSFFLEHIDEFKIGLSDYQILPDEDLIQLVQSDSDQKAIITLFTKYIKLIISISVKYLKKQSKEDLDGFIGIGIQGFLKAINDFDRSRNARFMYFASICMHNAFKSEYSSRMNKRFPRRKWLAYKNLLENIKILLTDVYKENILSKNRVNDLVQDLKNDCSTIDIDELNNLIKDIVGELKSNTGTIDPFSIHHKLLNVYEIVNKIRYPKEIPFEERDEIVKVNPASEEDILKKEMSLAMKEEIQKLPIKENLVLTHYYFEEMTLKKIGEILDVSESRVCQIHSKAIIKLRKKMRFRGFNNFFLENE